MQEQFLLPCTAFSYPFVRWLLLFSAVFCDCLPRMPLWVRVVGLVLILFSHDFVLNTRVCLLRLLQVRERVQGRAVLPRPHHQQERASTSRDELHHR